MFLHHRAGTILLKPPPFKPPPWTLGSRHAATGCHEADSGCLYLEQEDAPCSQKACTHLYCWQSNSVRFASAPMHSVERRSSNLSHSPEKVKAKQLVTSTAFATSVHNALKLPHSRALGAQICSPSTDGQCEKQDEHNCTLKQQLDLLQADS